MTLIKNTAWAAAALLVASFPVAAQRGSRPPAPANPFAGNQQAVIEGQALYNNTCTACHGKDGAGGDLGPPLAAPARRYLRPNDADVFDSIKNGIPATSMPPFKELSDNDAWKLAAYIHGLRGTAIDTPAQGNVARGSAIFWGKGDCGRCHMLGGKGGLIAPDLSDIAGQRKLVSIVEALTKPGHRVPTDGGTHDAALTPLNTYRPVRITTADGRTISGILRNEDSFSLQVLGSDNAIHLLERAKLKEVIYESKSPMQSDVDKRLTPEEFQDLLAFLTRQAIAASPPPARNGQPQGN
jgi:putative heme-binding domain-containing protein